MVNDVNRATCEPREKRARGLHAPCSLIATFPYKKLIGIVIVMIISVIITVIILVVLKALQNRSEMLRRLEITSALYELVKHRTTERHTKQLAIT